MSEAVTAPSGIARSAQALHHTLADAVVEGLRVNTEACLEALRRMGMPAPWGLHGRIAQWMRLNIDVGSRVTRAFLGAFTSADGISRR